MKTLNYQSDLYVRYADVRTFLNDVNREVREIAKNNSLDALLELPLKASEMTLNRVVEGLDGVVSASVPAEWKFDTDEDFFGGYPV